MNDGTGKGEASFSEVQLGILRLIAICLGSFWLFLVGSLTQSGVRKCTKRELPGVLSGYDLVADFWTFTFCLNQPGFSVLDSHKVCVFLHRGQQQPSLIWNTKRSPLKFRIGISVSNMDSVCVPW